MPEDKKGWLTLEQEDNTGQRQNTEKQMLLLNNITVRARPGAWHWPLERDKKVKIMNYNKFYILNEKLLNVIAFITKWLN